jgi:hypothetical protein
MGASGLGNLLVKEGFLTERDRQIISKTAGGEGWAFAKSVLSLGLLSENELTLFLAEKTRFKVISKQILGNLDSTVLDRFDLGLALKLEVLPISIEGTKLTVAVLDPLDSTMIRQLEFFTGFQVKPVIAPLSLIRDGLSMFRPDFRPLPSELEGFLSNHLISALQHHRLSDRSYVPGQNKAQSSSFQSSKSHPRVVRQEVSTSLADHDDVDIALEDSDFMESEQASHDLDSQDLDDPFEDNHRKSAHQETKQDSSSEDMTWDAPDAVSVEESNSDNAEDLLAEESKGSTSANTAPAMDELGLFEEAETSSSDKPQQQSPAPGSTQAEDDLLDELGLFKESSIEPDETDIKESSAPPTDELGLFEETATSSADKLQAQPPAQGSTKAQDELLDEIGLFQESSIESDETGTHESSPPPTTDELGLFDEPQSADTSKQAKTQDTAAAATGSLEMFDEPESAPVSQKSTGQNKESPTVADDGLDIFDEPTVPAPTTESTDPHDSMIEDLQPFDSLEAEPAIHPDEPAGPEAAAAQVANEADAQNTASDPLSHQDNQEPDLFDDIKPSSTESVASLDENKASDADISTQSATEDGFEVIDIEMPFDDTADEKEASIIDDEDFLGADDEAKQDISQDASDFPEQEKNESALKNESFELESIENMDFKSDLDEEVAVDDITESIPVDDPRQKTNKTKDPSMADSKLQLHPDKIIENTEDSMPDIETAFDSLDLTDIANDDDDLIENHQGSPSLNTPIKNSKSNPDLTKANELQVKQNKMMAGINHGLIKMSLATDQNKLKQVIAETLSCVFDSGIMVIHTSKQSTPFVAWRQTSCNRIEAEIHDLDQICNTSFMSHLSRQQSSPWAQLNADSSYLSSMDWFKKNRPVYSFYADDKSLPFLIIGTCDHGIENNKIIYEAILSFFRSLQNKGMKI